jgi:hypothetical protein
MGVYRKRGCCDPSYGGFRGRLVPRPRKTKLWCRFAHGSTFSIDAIGALKRGDELLLMWDVPEIVSKGLSPEDKAILEVSVKVPMRVRRAVCISLTRLLRSTHQSKGSLTTKKLSRERQPSRVNGLRLLD